MDFYKLGQILGQKALASMKGGTAPQSTSGWQSPGSQFDNSQEQMPSMNNPMLDTGAQMLQGAARGVSNSLKGAGQGLNQTVQGLNPMAPQTAGERVGNIVGGLTGMAGATALGPVSAGMGAISNTPLKPVADVIQATPEVMGRGFQQMYQGNPGESQNPVVQEFDKGAGMVNQAFSPLRQMIDNYAEMKKLNELAQQVLQEPEGRGAMQDSINSLIPEGTGRDIASQGADFMRTGGKDVASTAAGLAYYGTLGKAGKEGYKGLKGMVEENAFNYGQKQNQKYGYSYSNYAPGAWEQIREYLTTKKGYTPQAADEILRSKTTRWIADDVRYPKSYNPDSLNNAGYVTAKDFIKRFPEHEANVNDMLTSELGMPNNGKVVPYKNGVITPGNPDRQAQKNMRYDEKIQEQNRARGLDETGNSLTEIRNRNKPGEGPGAELKPGSQISGGIVGKRTGEPITADQFNRYENVRSGGQWNMFDPNARAATGLSSDEFLDVIDNYKALKQAYMGKPSSGAPVKNDVLAKGQENNFEKSNIAGKNPEYRGISKQEQQRLDEINTSLSTSGDPSIVQLKQLINKDLGISIKSLSGMSQSQLIKMAKSRMSISDYTRWIDSGFNPKFRSKESKFY